MAPTGWNTEAGEFEYSPDRVYSVATDRRGHSERLTIRLTPEILADVSHAVHGNQLRGMYETVSDFVRDAMFHRLKWLEANTIGFSPRMSMVLRGIELDVHRSTLERWNKYVEDTDEAMQYAIQKGDLSVLDALIEGAREAGDDMGQPWKARLDDLADRAETHERRLRKIGQV